MTSQDPTTTTPQQPVLDTLPPSSVSAIPSLPAPVKQDTSAAEGNPVEATPPANPRLAVLAAKRTTLESTLSALQSKRAALISQATLPSGLAMPKDWSDEQKSKQALASANAVIKEHIAFLHKYNEMKDIGQGLMGLIADKRGVRVSEVMAEFDMGEKD